MSSANFAIPDFWKNADSSLSSPRKRGYGQLGMTIVSGAAEAAPFQSELKLSRFDKLIGGGSVLFEVPTDGRLEFGEGGRVNLQRLSGH